VSDRLDPADLFAVTITRAAHDAARAYGYAPPSDRFVAEMIGRIPEMTRQMLGRGFAEGLVAPGPGGHTFAIASLSAAKGPYKWFSANRGPGVPSPNWEYFFQVAEFVRLSSQIDQRYSVGFEDGLMDVSVREGDDLLWYVEVKAKPAMLPPLLKALEEHGARVDLRRADRGNDPLRKAKYLVRHQPRWLSLVGGEERWHFAAQYPAIGSFTLVRRDDPLEELSHAKVLEGP
jgi:hypothetical protein